MKKLFIIAATVVSFSSQLFASQLTVEENSQLFVLEQMLENNEKNLVELSEVVRKILIYFI